MYPLHDKDLDRLSRNAAEHYELDFGPSGWEQLEKRLDQELPQKKDRRRFLFWLFFIVVTTGGALTGLLINSQPVTSIASNRIQVATTKVAENDGSVNKAVDQVNDRERATGTAGNNGNQPDIKKGEGDKGNNYREGKDRPVSMNKAGGNTPENMHTTGSNRPVTTDTRNSNKPVTMNTPGSNKPVSTPGSNRPVTMDAAGTKKPVTMNTPGGRNIANRKTINDNPVNTTDRSNDQPATTPQPVDKNDNTVVTVPAIDQPANTPNPTSAHSAKPSKTDSTAVNKKPAIPNRYIQPLELGLVAGPDASMVSFGPTYKAGYNFGVSVAYRFNNRWSVNTGAIYTRKYYQADSNTFHAPKRTYIAYVDLDVLKGYCAMWDFPVNVRYDYSFNDKRRFFASAGASTYLMKEQQYDYWYWQRGSGNYKDSSWGSYSEKQYAFSVLNLSLGYEKMIGKHFSIQAEPYLKIPLKGMGHGSMRIGSYGMFFSLKYRPTFQAKK